MSILDFKGLKFAFLSSSVTFLFKSVALRLEIFLPSGVNRIFVSFLDFEDKLSHFPPDIFRSIECYIGGILKGAMLVVGDL